MGPTEIDRARAALSTVTHEIQWRPRFENEVPVAELAAVIEDAQLAVIHALRDTHNTEAELRLSALVAELVEVGIALRRTADVPRWQPVVNVYQIVARLRSANTQSELAELAAMELRQLGFSRVLISRIDGDRWLPTLFWSQGRDEVANPIPATCPIAELRLNRNVIEFDLIRRLEAVLVENVDTNPRVLPTFKRTVGSSSYVAAPVVTGGRPAGMIHADCAAERAVTELDCTVLAVFASCFGHAVERLSLTTRLHGILREVSLSPDDMTDRAQALLNDRPAGQSAQGQDPEITRVGGEHTDLTRREREVLELLATGKSNSQIAETLVVAESTVKAHVKNILRKLHASNRAEAVARFFQG